MSSTKAPAKTQPLKARQAQLQRTKQTSEAERVIRGASALFDDFKKPINLRDGTVVEVIPGKTRHFGLLLTLFEKAVERMSPGQMARLFELIAGKQIVALNTGINPLSVSVDSEGMTEEEKQAKVLVQAKTVEDEEAIRESVRKALGTSSLVMSLARSVWDSLPEVIDSVCIGLTGEQWMELDIDEGAEVLFSVVAMNYDFFSRSRPQIFMAFAGLLESRLAGSQAK